MNKYSVKYFINKFEAIPEDKWRTGLDGVIESRAKGSYCAMGHTGFRVDLANENQPEEAKALDALFMGDNSEVTNSGYGAIWRINDGVEERFGTKRGTTPKQRILNALYSKLREGAAIK